jgi:hypothetical protein
VIRTATCFAWWLREECKHEHHIGLAGRQSGVYIGAGLNEEYFASGLGYAQ